MNNQEKIQAVKTALTEKGIEHWTGVDTPKKNVKIDIYLPKHNIAIFDGHDDEKFKAVRFFTFPVFIREEESFDFVLEKIQATIAKPTGSLKQGSTIWFKHHIKAEQKFCQKKKRNRKKITAVKVQH